MAADDRCPCNFCVTVLNSPTVKDTRFLDAIEEIRALHLKKNADYGTNEDPYANVRASEGWGVPPWQGAMIRATDKVIRLQKFAATGELANEPVEDAFLDLATYALIALVLYREGR